MKLPLLCVNSAPSLSLSPSVWRHSDPAVWGHKLTEHELYSTSIWSERDKRWKQRCWRQAWEGADAGALWNGAMWVSEVWGRVSEFVMCIYKVFLMGAMTTDDNWRNWKLSRLKPPNYKCAQPWRCVPSPTDLMLIDLEPVVRKKRNNKEGTLIISPEDGKLLVSPINIRHLLFYCLRY